MPLLSCALPELPCALPDLHSALPALKKKKCYFFYIFLFLYFQTADELYDACIFVPTFLSIAHKIVPGSCFVRVLDCARILGVHTLNCARFFVVCALHCARILVVRVLD